MSAFDKLQSYSAKGNNVIDKDDDLFNKVDSKLFDKTTPTGYFLRAIHRNGYKVIEKVYISEDDIKISEEKYLSLPDSEKCLYKEQLVKSELCNALTTSGDQLIISAAGSGKALENSTLVRTSKGDKPIGELTLEDEVIGSDLLPHKIIGIFPQAEKKQAYKITVGNGKEIKSCGEHLWTLDDGETKTTSELYEQYYSSERPYFLSLKNFGRTLYGDECLTIGQRILILLSAIGLDDISEERSRIESIYNDSSTDIDIQEYLSDRYINKDSWYGSEVDCFSENELDDCFMRTIKVARGLDIPLSFSGHDDTITLSNDFMSVSFCYSLGDIETSFNPVIFSDCLFDSEIVSDLEDKGCILMEEGSFSIILNDGQYKIESGVYNRIVNIEKTDEYLDMTCIQIDAEDKLYLLSCGVLTHNTTALVFKIMLDILNGEATKVVQIPNGQPIRVVDSIFVGTFLKTGAEELEEKLKAEQRRYGYEITATRVSFGTLHAEFYRALVAMGVPITIGKPEELQTMLRDSIRSMGVQRVNSSGALTSEDFQIIESVITYCRGRLDNQRYNHPAVSDYTNLTPTFLDTIIRSYKQKKQVANVMDFEDLQELLYQYLYVTPNKNVQDFIANRYKYIYLDEFQDTSQIQYAILKFYARGRAKCNKLAIVTEGLPEGYYTGVEERGKIVAIGDPDQTIYSWRGSDLNIISNSFDSDFAPCISILSRNYRCPENILTPISRSIKINKRAYDFPIQSAKMGGELYAYHFSSIKNMISQLSKDIDRDMNDGMSVAILCRTNFNGVIPAFMLEMEHKYNFSISSNQMTLSSPLPRKILSMTSLFTERTTKSVQSALEMFVYRGYAWKIKELIQTLKNDDTKNKRTSIWTLDERDIAYSCPEILDFVRAVKDIILDENGKRVQAKEVEALKFIYKYMRVNTYGGDSAYCESARAYIDSLLYLLDTKKFESVFEFQEEVQNYNDRLKARVGKKNTKISIVTVHEFKGKERDSTYIWNDSDMVFPSSKTNLEDENQVEEERRVHYIACTRARKRNTIYSIKGKEGIFLKEMGLELKDPIPIKGVLNSTGNSISAELEAEKTKMEEVLSEFDFDDSMPDIK